MHYPSLRLSLTCLLLLGLLSACGGEGDTSNATASSASAADAPANGASATHEVAAGECPLTFDLSQTYDPGDLPLGITFQYPEGWNVQSERAMDGGAVTVSLRRAFEVGGSRERIALELNKGGTVAPPEMIEMRTAPRSMGDLEMNAEQVTFQLGGESLTAGKTVDDEGKVAYALGLPADGGYYVTGLQLWWDSDDRCREEVITLGDEIVQSFEMR
jgi:hypothetical protein